MKKLLLVSALSVFATIGAAAQTIGVTVEGQAIENGSTVDSWNLIVTDLSLPGDPMFIYTLDPEVYASSVTTADFDITVKNVSPESVARQILFCWPEECDYIDPGESSTQSGKLTMQPSALHIDLAAVEGEEPLINYWPEAFAVNAIVTITEKFNKNNTFTFNLNMLYDPARNGVSSMVAEDIKPVYYDLCGRLVANPEKGQILIEKRGAKTVKVIM